MFSYLTVILLVNVYFSRWICSSSYVIELSNGSALPLAPLLAGCPLLLSPDDEGSSSSLIIFSCSRVGLCTPYCCKNPDGAVPCSAPLL